LSAGISGPPNAELIAHFLRRRFRVPARNDAQARREARALGNLEVVLRLALGVPVEFTDPALRGPAAAALLERDALSCITRCFFPDDATHYEVLGLAPDASPEAVRENFRLLMQLIHPDRQGAGTLWPENLAARANGAYAVLKVPETRVAYDSELATARLREQAARGDAKSPGGSYASGRTTAYRRRSEPADALPEWLTLDVGGYLREHPAFSSVVAIVVGSASIIGALAWEGRVATLTRETRASGPETAKPEMPASELPAASPLAVTAVPTTSVAAVTAVPDPAQSIPTPVPAKSESFALGVPERAPPVTAPIAAHRGAIALPKPEANPSRIAPVPEPIPAVPVRPTLPADTAPVRPTLPTDAAPVAETGPVASLSGRGSVAERPEPRAPVVAAAAAPTPPAASALAEPVTATAQPPATAEIEAFFAAFVDSYEKGRLDALAALFDDDAEMNLRRGRPAIRGEYDELFRQSSSRRMQLTRINWRRVGDRAHAKGGIVVKIGWRDGREVEQRIAVDMELVRRDGRALIAKLSQQPRN